MSPSKRPNANPGGGAGGGGGARGRLSAGLHERAGRWHTVVIERAGQPRVVEARSWSAAESAAMAAWLGGLEVGSTTVVVPGRHVVSRVVIVPEGEAASMQAAAGLIAEAELPTKTPAHRRAAGIVDLPAPAGQRAALLVGWVGPPVVVRALGGERARVWCAESAALAALIGGGGPGLALALDEQEGALTALACGDRRSAVRSTLLGSAGAGRRAAEAGMELARTVGLAGDGGVGEVLPGGLWLDAESRARLARTVGGARADESWLRDYGVALGAALAAGNPAPGWRALACMTDEPPRARRRTVEQLAGWLAQPRVAYGAIAAALAVILLGPLGLAAARHAVLTARAGGLAEQQERERELDRQIELYRELGKRRWPVSKLLADIAGAAPVGVELVAITLEQEKNSITLQGTAAAPEQANEAQTRMNASGVFADLIGNKSQSEDDDSGGVEFNLSGRVQSPFAKAKNAEDFASNPLAKRLYGEDAALVTGSDEPEPRANGRDRASGESRDRGGGGGGGGSGSRASRGAKPADIPPELTDEAIAAMDRATATKAWSERKRAASTAGIDAAVKDRLKSEVDKLRARMDAARAAPSAAGGTTGASPPDSATPAAESAPGSTKSEPAPSSGGGGG